MAQEIHPSVTQSSADAARRRRGRSWAILMVLFALCILFYAITIVKMGHL